jgi:hypothetical protein
MNEIVGKILDYQKCVLMRRFCALLVFFFMVEPSSFNEDGFRMERKDPLGTLLS